MADPPTYVIGPDGLLLDPPHYGQSVSGEWVVINPDGSVKHTGVMGAAPGTSSSTSSSTSTNVSSSTSQSLQDPAYLAYLRDKDRQDQQAANAALQADITYKTGLLDNAQKQINLSQGNLDFLKSKQAFEESTGLAADARATQQQVFTQQNAVAGLQMQMATTRADIQAANAQLQFQVQQANVQAAQQKQNQLQSLATNIGTLAADPGDRAKYASTVLANGGWGQANTALATGDLRTNESLTPLQALLNQRTGVMNQSDNPITMPTMPSLDTSGVQMPVPGAPISAANYGQQAPGAPGAPAAPPQAAPAPAPTPAQEAPKQAAPAPAIGSPDWIAALIAQGFTQTPAAATPPPAAVAPPPPPAAVAPPPFDLSTLSANAGQLPGYAEGGMTQGAYISGEEGPEINIPLGPGVAMVINKSQMKAMQTGGMEKMADGGIFGAQNIDTSQALSFVNQSAQNATAGTPWAGQRVPSPVYASSPGFDPAVAQFLASIFAQQTGTPASSYARMAQMYAPQGATQQNIRRTA